MIKNIFLFSFLIFIFSCILSAQEDAGADQEINIMVPSVTGEPGVNNPANNVVQEAEENLPAEKANINKKENQTQNKTENATQKKNFKVVAGIRIEKVEFPDALERDPTLSEKERERIAFIKAEKLRREREEKEAREAAERKKQQEEELRRQREEALRKDPSREVKSRIYIQGLIDKEAIINGQIYSEGDGFYVKGNRNRIKVISVKSDRIIFEYKGKRFSKQIVVKN